MQSLMQLIADSELVTDKELDDAWRASFKRANENPTEGAANVENHFHISGLTKESAVLGCKIALQAARDLELNPSQRQDMKRMLSFQWWHDIDQQSWVSADISRLAEHLCKLNILPSTIFRECLSSGLDYDRERVALSTLESFGCLRITPGNLTDGCCKSCSEIELTFKADTPPQTEQTESAVADWQPFSPDEFVVRSHKSGVWQASIKFGESSTSVSAHKLEDLFKGLGEVFARELEYRAPPS